jgi:hypothetical protein
MRWTRSNTADRRHATDGWIITPGPGADSRQPTLVTMPPDLPPANPAALMGAFKTKVHLQRGCRLVGSFTHEFGRVERAPAAELGMSVESHLQGAAAHRAGGLDGARAAALRVASSADPRAAVPAMAQPRRRF